MKSSNSLKVGIVAFLSICVLIVGLLWKSGVFMKANCYRIYGQFETVNGLLLNSPVRYRGYLVGYVEAIKPGPNDINVTLIIKNGVELPANARMRVSFDGLIGEKYMDLLAMEATQDILKPGSTIPGFAARGLVDFVDVGTQNLEETKKIISSLGEIMTSPEVSKSIRDTMIRLDSISTRFDQLLANMTKFTSSDEMSSLVKSFEQTATTLRITTEKLLSEEQVSNISASVVNLRDSLENIKKITGEIESITSMIADAANDENTTKNIGIMLENTNKLLVNINEALATTNFNKTLAEANTAVSRASRLVTNLSSIDFSPRANTIYGQPGGAYWEAGLDIGYGNMMTRMGFSNRDHDTSFSDFQIGNTFYKDVTGRIGRINSAPGIGLDYTPFDRVTFSGELFYNEKVNTVFRVYYNIIDKIHILLGTENLNNKENKFTIGIGL